MSKSLYQRREVELAVQDQIVHLVPVLRVERREAHDHLVCEGRKTTEKHARVSQPVRRGWRVAVGTP